MAHRTSYDRPNRYSCPVGYPGASPPPRFYPLNWPQIRVQDQPWGSCASRAGASPRSVSAACAACLTPNQPCPPPRLRRLPHPRTLLLPSHASIASHQRHRDRIYEATDLGQFRGKRIIVDAAGFFFWLMEDVMGKQVRACSDGWGCSVTVGSVDQSAFPSFLRPNGRSISA